ncbi:MAG TPA: hypothetical protein VKG85_01660 [Actinomycetes bacterium]|nr:hypothetical protein [Actinomycetes bacterium]
MGLSARRIHIPHPTLNTDGRRHPLANTLTTLTVLFGLVALFCALDPSRHVLGSWAGMIGAITGFSAQLISATTAERAVNVIAIGGAVVGWGLNMAQGGFF